MVLRTSSTVSLVGGDGDGFIIDVRSEAVGDDRAPTSRARPPCQVRAARRRISKIVSLALSHHVWGSARVERRTGASGNASAISAKNAAAGQSSTEPYPANNSLHSGRLPSAARRQTATSSGRGQTPRTCGTPAGQATAPEQS